MLTTHYIEEAERLCDRVAIVDDGQIIAQGSPRELQEKSANQSAIEVTLNAPCAAETLPAWSHTISSTLSADRRRITARSSHPGRTLVEMVKWIDAQGLEPEDVRLNRPTL